MLQWMHHYASLLDFVFLHFENHTFQFLPFSQCSLLLNSEKGHEWAFGVLYQLFKTSCLILNEADYILIPGLYLSGIITGVGSFHGGTRSDDSSGMTFLSAVTVLLTKLYS